MAVQSHALLPLQCSSDLRAVNGDRPKRSNLRVMSRVPGQQIMMGHTFQEQLLDLWKMFQQFPEAQQKLSWEKCQLFENYVWYLMHIVSPEGLTTDPKEQTRD